MLPTPRRSRASFSVALVAVAYAAAGTASLGAQHATPRGEMAAQDPVPVAAYPLMPTPVLESRGLTAGPAFSGYVSVRETLRNDSTVFNLNRARLTVMGAPRRGLAFRIQADLSNAGRLARDSSVAAAVLTDAYVQLGYVPSSPGDSASWLASFAPALVAGQFRVPFSLEFLTPFSLLKTANRSLVVDRLSPRRDIGAMGQVRLTRFATLAAAVVNGTGSNQPRNPDNAILAAGRLTLRPAARLALAGKWASEGPDHMWGYDARWTGRVLTLEGEVLHRTGRPPGQTDAALPRYGARGGYALAALRIRPWVEPVVKWERFREDTTGRPRQTWTTAGVVLRAPDDRIRFHVNWIDKRGPSGVQAGDELLAQLIAIF